MISDSVLRYLDRLESMEPDPVLWERIQNLRNDVGEQETS